MSILKNQSGLLTAFTLKIMAFVLMVLDHIYQMWAHFDAPLWLTMLGRPVFPIFLFLIAESFHYTRNRKKLLLRLLIASQLMTIVNLLLNSYILPNHDIILINNAFSTFFISVLYMLFYEIFKDGIKQKSAKKIIGSLVLASLPILVVIPIGYIAFYENSPLWLIRALSLIPNAVIVEGGTVMVFLGFMFYALRPWRWAQALVLLALSVLQFIVDPTSIQWMMVFAIVPIFLYNGEKGRSMKNFFYIGYPLHIYLLYILATLTQT